MASAQSLHIVYGGTFDPVHVGHVAIAESAYAALRATGLKLARFDFLPNADPPHRAVPGAAAGHRVAMLWLALASRPQFGIDLRELRRGGPSYMVETLESLRAELGAEAPLVLMMGEDAWRGFARWQRWQDIPALAHVLVVNRPHASDTSPQPGSVEAEAEPETLASHAAPPALAACVRERAGALSDLGRAPAGRVVFMELPPHRASATAVREAVSQGDYDALATLVSPEVSAYIARHRLYLPTEAAPGV